MWGLIIPTPKSIGADRLANAAAVAALYGCPAIVVDFGTAVTFDIVSARRNYIGGVIAPGLEAMTNFLYQRTALLPKLSLKEPRRAIGRSTIEAMLSGAVFGYRGLVREILARIRAEQFPRRKLHVVATGGYARLIAAQLPEIDGGSSTPHSGRTADRSESQFMIWLDAIAAVEQIVLGTVLRNWAENRLSSQIWTCH